MGDGEKAPLRLQFNPKVRLEFHGSTITSDAGLLAFREFDDALGLTEIAEDYLQESRTGRNILHHLVPLLRQSIYSRLAGYDDTNDAVRLSQDPAMRVIVGWQGSERKGASTSEMGRFETEFLTQEDNLKGLARINTQWVERAMAHTLHRRVILDMDSSESPVHGQQEGAAYNGHFECVCYHPLFLFNQFGDCEAAKLRSGNVPSADDWQEVLDPVVERYLTAAVRLLFRADAAFAKPEIYDYLEARNIGYAIRLRSNQVLQREIAHRLIRPTEWLSPKPIVSYHDFVYQAQSWNVARRVVSKVEWHQGELFPRVGFIVTNLSYPNIGIVRFYNGRGTAEQWIKEGKYALNWTRLSCHKFVANQVRLELFVLAYNLGNFMRRLALPEAMKHGLGGPRCTPGQSGALPPAHPVWSDVLAEDLPPRPASILPPGTAAWYGTPYPQTCPAPQLHEKASLTGGNEALVVDQSADQDDQDWRTVGAPCRKAGVSAC